MSFAEDMVTRRLVTVPPEDRPLFLEALGEAGNGLYILIDQHAEELVDCPRDPEVVGYCQLPTDPAPVFAAAVKEFREGIESRYGPIGGEAYRFAVDLMMESDRIAAALRRGDT